MKGNVYSLFVLIAAFFWGTTGTVQAMAQAPHRWHSERSDY